MRVDVFTSLTVAVTVIATTVALVQLAIVRHHRKSSNVKRRVVLDKIVAEALAARDSYDSVEYHYYVGLDPHGDRLVERHAEEAESMEMRLSDV